MSAMDGRLERWMATVLQFAGCVSGRGNKMSDENEYLESLFTTEINGKPLQVFSPVELMETILEQRAKITRLDMYQSTYSLAVESIIQVVKEKDREIFDLKTANAIHKANNEKLEKIIADLESENIALKAELDVFEEIKEEIEPDLDEYYAFMKEAQKKVVEFINSQKDVPADVIEACKACFGTLRETIEKSEDER